MSEKMARPTDQAGEAQQGPVVMTDQERKDTGTEDKLAPNEGTKPPAQPTFCKLVVKLDGRGIADEPCGWEWDRMTVPQAVESSISAKELAETYTHLGSKHPV